MKKTALKNVSKNTILAEKVWRAESWLEKIGGLLIRPRLQEGEALLIPSVAPWVHSFFMKYPIDVAVLDRKGRVLAARTLAPWRMTRPYPAGCLVIELTEGTLKNSNTQYGDQITIA